MYVYILLNTFTYTYIKLCKFSYTIIHISIIFYKYNLINNTKDLNKLINHIKKTGYCEIDTETNTITLDKNLFFT